MSKSHTLHRHSMAVSSSLYVIVDKDKPVCGFLNRKTVTDASGKKSKDRTWQSLWCQVKEGKIEFYKVNGINLKPHGEPPPRDIYPPPNRQKHKTGFVDLENSLVEIDFTSQKEKDLDKRRRFLFRLILSNNMEYLLQAPSENQMLQWVSSVKKATWSNDEEMEGPSELFKQDARIKASRCSINKKSKHNTNSVRVTGNVLEGEDDVDVSFTSLTQLDPRLVLLRERLQNKRDLLRQLQKMLNSFSGDTECLYKEAETPGSRQNSTRLSNLQSVSTEHEIEAVNRQSAGSDSLSNDGTTRVMTTVLEDYYLVPGVKWSLLKKGDSVEVLGRLSNGWYRCRANRDATFELGTFPSSSEGVELMNVEEEKREEQVITPVDGEEDSFGNDLRQSTIPLEKSSTFVNGNHKEEETMENKMVGREEKENGESQDDSRESIPKEGSVFENSTTDSIDLSFASSIVDREEEFTDFSEDGIQKEQLSLHSPRVRTESYMMATTDFPMRLTITRKDSYNVATTTGLIDSVKVPGSQKTRHLSMIETHNIIISDFSHEYELKKLRINNILDHERANNKYDFPLVGAIPSSMLQHFVDQPVSGIRPSSSTSDYGSSAPITEDSPGVNFKTKFNNISASISMEESFQTTCSSEVSGGVDIPNTRKNVEEDIGSLTGSINVGSVPSKLFIHTDDKGPPLHNRKDRASSLPPNAIESIEDSSSFTLERERISLSEAPSPELREEEEHEGEEEEDEEEEQFKLFQVQRSNSKKMKVIPSPVSTLERRVLDGDNHQVTTNDWKVNDVRRHKRSNSEEDIEKNKKGFFSRIRSNLRGHRKTRPSESSSSPGTPGYTLGVDEFGDELPLRSRVTSISGKKIRSRGMGVTFGDSSSESESEETEEKGNRLTVKNADTGSRSVGSSPLRMRKIKSEEEQSPLTRIELPHDPVFKTKSTPLETLRLNLQNQSDSTETDRIRPESRSVSEKRKSPMDGNHKMSGFVQAPAKGVRRQISLKPSQKKYGFHLEHYELNMNQAKIPRTIVQYVVPGSPAFVAGLYAGDQILSVNKQNLKTAPVSEVVKAIQEADLNKSIELVVAFVDGALRLKVQQKGEEYRMKLHDKQMSLQQVLASEERQSKFSVPSLPTTKYTCTSANELESWKEDTPPEENSLHVYNFNRYMNSMLSLHHGDITQLSCDMLVIPIRDEDKISEHGVNHVLKAGGEGLLNELCLAEHCALGDNIVTSGHDLPVEAICHTVFGSNEENIISCVRSALETAYEQCYQTIVFWIDGFISARVSPHLIIGTVRGWLEEDDNCGVFLKVIFSIPSSPAMISLIERYFPLEDYELQKYLQELEYFTSDDEDETDGQDEKQEELQEGDSRTRDSEQLSQSLEQDEERVVCCEDSSNKQTISNSSSPSTDRKTYIQTKFGEIDAIFDSINF